MKDILRELLTPPAYVLVTMRYVVFIIISLFMSIFLPWYVFTSGMGRVTAIDPNERIQEINAPLAGFIDKWNVTEGSYLKKGELIVDLIDADINLLDRMQRERRAAQSALESSRLALETARLNVSRQEKLLQDGLASRKDYEKAKIEASKLEVDVAKALATLTKAETQVSRQSTQKITAPRDGRVLRILPGEGNQLVKAGDPLVVFAPEVRSPAVELWVNGRDLPFIKEGQNARIQFEGWPAIQIPGWPSLSIGTFDAKVFLVDHASSFQGKFRVVLMGDVNDWPSDDFVRLNAQARGIIYLRKSRLGLEVWRQLNDFPPLLGPIRDELSRMLIRKSDRSSEEKKEEKGEVK